MRTIGFMLFLIIFIMVLSNIAAMVDKSNGIPDVFSMLYPEKFVDSEEQKALDTGVVPFASEDAQAPVFAEPAEQYTIDSAAPTKNVNLDTQDIYDPLAGNVAVSKELHVPHRHEAAVNDWVTEAVTEIMTFKISEYQKHYQDMAALMDANGLAEWQKFLVDTNILAIMQSKKYELRSFVSDVPRMVTTGVVSDRIRWVYDVPVSLTFLPEGRADYDELDKSEYQFEELSFRIQIGRVAQGGRDGIAVETWEALKRKKSGG